MIAIEIQHPGGPEVLVPVERPTPAPAVGEVLIEVAAAGVNRPDIFQRLGRFPPPPRVTHIPGLEVSWTGGDVSAHLLAFPLPLPLSPPQPPSSAAPFSACHSPHT